MAIEMKIVKRGSKWIVQTEDGSRDLGEHDTKESAIAQLRAIESRKHMQRGLFGPLVRLDNLRDESGKVRVGLWDRAATFGKKPKDGVEVDFSAQTFGQMIDGWLRRGERLSLCYNHQSAYTEENGEPAPALAYYDAVALVEGGQVVRFEKLHVSQAAEPDPAVLTRQVAVLATDDNPDPSPDGLWWYRSEVTEPVGQILLPTFKYISPMFVTDGKSEFGELMGYTIYDLAATNTAFQAGCILCFDRHGRLSVRMAKFKKGDHVVTRDGRSGVVVDSFPSPNAPGGDSVTIETNHGTLTLPEREVEKDPATMSRRVTQMAYSLDDLRAAVGREAEISGPGGIDTHVKIIKVEGDGTVEVEELHHGGHRLWVRPADVVRLLSGSDLRVTRMAVPRGSLRDGDHIEYKDRSGGTHRGRIISPPDAGADVGAIWVVRDENPDKDDLIGWDDVVRKLSRHSGGTTMAKKFDEEMAKRLGIEEGADAGAIKQAYRRRMEEARGMLAAEDDSKKLLDEAKRLDEEAAAYEQAFGVGGGESGAEGNEEKPHEVMRRLAAKMKRMAAPVEEPHTADKPSTGSEPPVDGAEKELVGRMTSEGVPEDEAKQLARMALRFGLDPSRATRRTIFAAAAAGSIPAERVASIVSQKLEEALAAERQKREQQDRIDKATALFEAAVQGGYPADMREEFVTFATTNLEAAKKVFASYVKQGGQLFERVTHSGAPAGTGRGGTGTAPTVIRQHGAVRVVKYACDFAAEARKLAREKGMKYEAALDQVQREKPELYQQYLSASS